MKSIRIEVDLMGRPYTFQGELHSDGSATLRDEGGVFTLDSLKAFRQRHPHARVWVNGQGGRLVQL